MTRRTLFLSSAIFALSAARVYAGGPPILTILKMPEYLTVGRPETVQFAVRSWCCDNQPMTFNGYFVRASKSGSPGIEFAASPIGNSGEYVAKLNLPTAGEWTFNVVFGSQGLVTSPPFHRKAIAAGSNVPKELSLEARGERSFIEKGCISCHINQGIAGPKYPTWGERSAGNDLWEGTLRDVGFPDLTDRKFPVGYLEMFLADPVGVHPGTRMPNLGLNSEDISMLIAFMNRIRPTKITAER